MSLKTAKKKTTLSTKKQMADIEAKRAKAYADMEPHLCDVVLMGEIATSLFDCSDQGLFVFAVGHLEEMLLELRKRYYASDFQP
jgi:hypothetical protein